MAKRDNYWWRCLKSWDQLINAHTGGDEDETISSRMGKAVEAKRDCWICHTLCKMLHWIDPNHCQDSIERDEGKTL
jgi:hypothetical protein